MRHIDNKQPGFSAIELLITLFIAAVFLMSGYMLYASVIKNGGESRAKTSAFNAADDYLQAYKTSATSPCTTQNPLDDSPIDVQGLTNVKVSVSIECPNLSKSIESVSKIVVTLKYNTPQELITDATYVYK